MRSGTVSAEGRLIKLGRQTSYTEGFVRDGSGNLYGVALGGGAAFVTADKVEYINTGQWLSERARTAGPQSNVKD